MQKHLVAVYRLQFNPQFTFNDAIAVIEYLAALNISHIYASPYLQAAAGSQHGYDVINPSEVNRELGGDEGLQKFCQALQEKKLSQVLDIVPNHMAAKCPDNIWWTDVLKYGRISPYANYFDIHWRCFAKQSGAKILLPVLQSTYKKELKNRNIQLQYNHGIFTINYFNQIFPVATLSLVDILEEVARRLNLKSLLSVLSQLNGDNEIWTDYLKLQICEQKILENFRQNHEVSQAIEQIIVAINRDAKKLDDFLKMQHYCLVSWRTAKWLLGYRRFFHLNHLVGLRIEDKQVFMDAHELILRWLKAGTIDGFRIDHVDGLRDPLQYLERLREFAPTIWMVAEKILSKNEVLPKNLPIDGTTGYDFLNLVNGLFIASHNEKLFTDFYIKFIGGDGCYEKVLQEKKRLVLKRLLSGDVNFLTEIAFKICQKHKRCKRFTFTEMRSAIREVIACFPVYRTYIRNEQEKISSQDKKIILLAIDRAKQTKPQLKQAIFEFIKSLLLLKYVGENEAEFVMRFQQLTGAAMAKGGEDTAFYCFNRFIALNEVGGEPAAFGVSAESFHRIMRANAKEKPYSMLATSTHDTKRSEDVRARLALLSEIPDAWFKFVRHLVAYNEKYHAASVPDRNTQYFLYQNLVGVWPIAKERLLIFAEKAIREAKVYTSWFYPDANYEQKVHCFIEEILADQEFCSLLETFVAPLIKFNQINSLAQLAIKLTAPGVPDFYQGAELWNFTLVDPDNRRSIDFKAHYRLFKEMLSLSLSDIMQRMDEGLPKLWLSYKTLNFRKQHAELFAGASYIPSKMQGEKAQHGIAFLRGKNVLTFAPRLVMALKDDWGKTYLAIPSGTWHNILTEETIVGGKVLIKEIIKKFPVAIFYKRIT